jgi:MFS-type transporter involved in bile tolerance (Atg22 family)
VEQLLQAEPVEAPSRNRISIRKIAAAWLLEKRFSRSFWVFFAVALFFDFGFSVYFFLFNLYLLDFHFNERTIGLVGGALALGSMAGTLPVGWLARKTGLRPLLAICMTAAPLLGVARATVMWEPAQIGLESASCQRWQGLRRRRTARLHSVSISRRASALRRWAYWYAAICPSG